MVKFTISELSEKLNGKVIGDGSISIDSLAQMDEAGQGQLTFLGSKKFEKNWKFSAASAALVNSSSNLQPTEGKALILVENAKFAMIEALH